MKTELLVPTTSSTQDWPRRVSNAVKYLLQDAGRAVDSIAALTATNTTQTADIAAHAGRLAALEAASGIAITHPFVQLAAAPGTPTEGQTYYDTVLHKARTWDGTAWQALW